MIVVMDAYVSVVDEELQSSENIPSEYPEKGNVKCVFCLPTE